MRRRRPPRLRGIAALALGGLLGTLALAGPASASERATLRLLGSSPIHTRVDVHKAAGGSVAVRPARYHYRITTGAGTSETSGHCIDLSHYIVTGRDYQVDLQTAADAPELGSPEFLAAGWLLQQEDDLIAAASDPGLEAGAIQVAVWQLSGQARGLDAPTSSPALNARVTALRNEAMGRSVTSALDVAVDAPADGACLDTGARVRVSGTPGAEVDLAVTEGEGTVSPARVVLDEGGEGQAVLRAADVGEVTVGATTAAPELVRAAKLAGQTSPQDQLLLRPGTLTDTATQAFIDCTVFTFGPSVPESPSAPAPTAPGASPAPGAPESAPAAPAPAPAPAALALDLTGPRMAAPGGTAVYRLRVTNTGGRTATGLRVRQGLGRGIAAIAARGPAGSSARVGRDVAVWRLRALAPGRSAVLTLRVRVGRRVTGGIVRTRAAARAGTRSASAAGTTAVVRRVGKTEQGF